MRHKLYAGLLLMVLIIGGTSIYLGLNRSSQSTLGTQALLPSYGTFQFYGGHLITLGGIMLDTNVTSLFGSKENITAVRLWGPDGEIEEIRDWRVSMLISTKQVGNPVAHMRRLDIDIVPPDRSMKLTDIEFTFANGMRKSFPFGELLLFPRRDTSIEEMLARTGMYWEILNGRNMYSKSAGGTTFDGFILELHISSDQALSSYMLTEIDLGNCLYSIDKSSAALVDNQVFMQALRDEVEMKQAFLSTDFGLPLPIVFPHQSSDVTLILSLERKPALLTMSYIHPVITLVSETGEEITVALANPIISGGIDPYSEESAQFLKEWGR